ncbi:MAG: energy transducer TonB [Planctomycetes bacterium]|nr:energy transducer TonB [Planctomycetota bacterium]
MSPTPRAASIPPAAPVPAPALPVFAAESRPAADAPPKAVGSPERAELAYPWSGTYVRPPVFTPARPDPRASPLPLFPREARFAGSVGIVVLFVRVSAKGAVTEARIEESTGSGPLDRAALDAVARWRFLPARLDGAPVDSEVLVPVRFRLE